MAPPPPPPLPSTHPFHLDHLPLPPATPGYPNLAISDYHHMANPYSCTSANSCKRKRSSRCNSAAESSSSTEVIALSAESLMAANRSAPPAAAAGKCRKEHDSSLLKDHQRLNGSLHSDDSTRIHSAHYSTTSANYAAASDDDESDQDMEAVVDTDYSNPITLNALAAKEMGRGMDHMSHGREPYASLPPPHLNLNKLHSSLIPSNHPHKTFYPGNKLLNFHSSDSSTYVNNPDGMIKRRVYICPVQTCVHHHRSKALGDLTGIRKHFNRKHGERKWKCERCPKTYAVQSDWKAHLKICGLREFICDFCNQIFTRKDKFSKHRDYCRALTEEKARVVTDNYNGGAASVATAADRSATAVVMCAAPVAALAGEISSDHSCTSTNSAINSADRDANYNPNYGNPVSNCPNYCPPRSLIHDRMRNYSANHPRDATHDHNQQLFHNCRSSSGNCYGRYVPIGRLPAEDAMAKDSKLSDLGLALNSAAGNVNNSNLLQQQQPTELQNNHNYPAHGVDPPQSISGFNYSNRNQLQLQDEDHGVINERARGVINANTRDLSTNCGLSIGGSSYQLVLRRSTERDYTDINYGHKMIRDPSRRAAEGENHAAVKVYGNGSRINDDQIVTRDLLSNLELPAVYPA